MRNLKPVYGGLGGLSGFRHYRGGSISASLRSHRQRLRHGPRRHFSEGPISSILSALPGPLVPPVILVSLTVALWTFKCINIVVFQNKIIYIPYMPPFARSEKLDDYRKGNGLAEWREEQINSLDGTKLSIMVGSLPHQENDCKSVLVLYFQGNGGSSPMRIPMLSGCLRDIQAKTGGRVSIAALSYRGFWSSRGKPSQTGIELDARAFLDWARTSQPDARIVLWGQSLGAGVALSTISSLARHGSGYDNIAAIILETPFVSLKRMLLALYPQKWLPYRLLGPFLRNHWDSEAALRDVAAGNMQPPPILLMPAADDEVVPPEEADHLQAMCDELKLPYQREDILGAFHNDASSKSQGRRAIASFIACNV